MTSFNELEMRFGMAAAWQLLNEIEKASGIRCEDSFATDPEVRFANAVRVQQDARRFGQAA